MQPPVGHRERYFDRRMILTGFLAGLAWTVFLALLFLFVFMGSLPESVWIPWTLSAGVVGATLALLPGSPSRHGLGLGLVVGWLTTAPVLAIVAIAYLVVACELDGNVSLC